MAVVIDKILGGPLLHDHPIKTGTSDPATGKDGLLFINTTDHQIKVYYDESWQVLHTLDFGEALLLETGDKLLLETGDKLLFD